MTIKRIGKVCYRNLLVLAAVVVFTVGGTNTLMAQGQEQTPKQEKISDEELQKFANAAIKIQQIQTVAQEDMLKSVGDSDMEVERFNEISQAVQSGSDPKVTEEEQKQLEEINNRLTAIQQKADSDMVAAIETEGMTIERFQQIYTQLQADPELQQRMQKLTKG